MAFRPLPYSAVPPPPYSRPVPLSVDNVLPVAGEGTERVYDDEPDAVGEAAQLTPEEALAIVWAIQGHSPSESAEVLERPHVLAHQRQCEAALVARIQQGEFGPTAMAKAKAEQMLAVLIDKAERSKQDNVSRQAALDVLGLAGFVAVKKAEVLNVNELIDQMREDELDTFITSGRIPPRLRNNGSGMFAPTGRRVIDLSPGEPLTDRD